MAVRGIFQSKPFLLSCKLLLTLAAFWFVASGLDMQHLSDILKTQDRMLLLEASALVIFQNFLGAERWRMMVRGIGLGKVEFGHWPAQKIYFIGSFFTCCLPGTIGGDVVRVWMCRDYHVPTGVAVNSVIVDRMVALGVICLLALFSLPVLMAGQEDWVQITYMAAGALLISGVVAIYASEAMLARWQHKRIVSWLLFFLRSLTFVLSRPGFLVKLVLMAMVAHISYALTGYVVAQSMGISMSVLQAVAYIPLVMLVTTIPVSVGGWGIREVTMVALLSQIGVAPEAALMLSVQMGLLVLVLTLPAGFLWLAHRRQHGGALPVDEIAVEPPHA